MQFPPAVLSVTRRLRQVPPLAILAIGWGIAVIYAYPGLVSLDSLDQLIEARKGVYTDGHPPFMQLMWHVVDSVIAGTLGMFALQNAAFLCGMYLLLKRALPPRGAALAATLIFIFPPVLCTMVVIWKDCLMAGFFMLGTAALLDDRRKVKLLGLACLFIATAVRYNALAAAMPLIVLLFDWGKQRVARYALAAGLWLAISIAALGTNVALTDIQMHFWQSSLAVLDIAGTLANVDGTIPDDELKKTFDGTKLLVDKDIHAAIKQRYSSDDFAPLIFGAGHLWDLPIEGNVPAPEPQREAIGRAFWELVAAHPGAYLKHRIDVFLDVIGASSNDGTVVMTFHSSYREYMENLGLDSHPTRTQLRWQARASWIAKHTWLFKPVLYLLVALVLLGINRDRDVLALLLSGIGIESSLFLLAPTPDYRYSHWLVVCTLVSAVMVIARKKRT